LLLDRPAPTLVPYTTLLRSSDLHVSTAFSTLSRTSALTSSVINSFTTAIFNPLISLSISSSTFTSSSADVPSNSSTPLNTSSKIALSLTVLVIGPIASNDEPNAFPQKRDTQP